MSCCYASLHVRQVYRHSNCSFITHAKQRRQPISTTNRTITTNDYYLWSVRNLLIVMTTYKNVSRWYVANISCTMIMIPKLRTDEEIERQTDCKGDQTKVTNTRDAKEKRKVIIAMKIIFKTGFARVGNEKWQKFL